MLHQCTDVRGSLPDSLMSYITGVDNPGEGCTNSNGHLEGWPSSILYTSFESQETQAASQAPHTPA